MTLHPTPQSLRAHGRGRIDYRRQRVTGAPLQPGKAVTGVAATDLFTANGHGYAVGDRVEFSALTGGTGITPGQSYFVIASGLTANAFRVSATLGGATINFTTDLTAGTVARRIFNHASAKA